MPERIQLHRNKGWRKPEGAIVVTRPNRWGNPFAYRTYRALARVPALDGSAWEYEGRLSADGMQHDYHHPDGSVTVHHIRYMTPGECVEMYRRALVAPDPHIHLFDRSTRAYLTVEDARRELAGRDLCCWCAPGDPCHADVLLEIANAAQAVAR
jgi:hypothetical protein